MIFILTLIFTGKTNNHLFVAVVVVIVNKFYYLFTREVGEEVDIIIFERLSIITISLNSEIKKRDYLPS